MTPLAPLSVETRRRSVSLTEEGDDESPLLRKPVNLSCWAALTLAQVPL
jgi:hypothetical protein